MAVTVKKIALWRVEMENKPGALAGALAPLAQAGDDLQVVLGYGDPEGSARGIAGVFPVQGKKVIDAAKKAGFALAQTPALLVEGDNRIGLGHVLAQALADAGVNIGYLAAQAIGKKFSAVYGFASDEDAKKGSAIIKKASAARKPAAKKPAANKPAARKVAATKVAAKKTTAKKPAAKSK